MLRPPFADERITNGPDGLVRLALKRPFGDSTVAIDLDPLSLLCRLAASLFGALTRVFVQKVLAFYTDRMKKAGVSGGDSGAVVRSSVHLQICDSIHTFTCSFSTASTKRKERTWCFTRCRIARTELLATLGIDALACPKCAGRMRVVRLVRDAHDIRKNLTAMGEATEPPARGPTFWASRALRIRSNADAA